MSRTLRIRPTGAAAILGVMIGAVALAGCGAGQITQTSSQVTAVGGANVTAGTLAIRNAVIDFPEGASGVNSYPPGSSAPLTMIIVNSGGQADRLVSASAKDAEGNPLAQSVQVSSGAEIAAGRTLSIEGKPAPVAVPTPTGAPSTGTTITLSPGTGATATPRPTGSATATPTPTPAPTTSAAPAGAERQAHIVLTGLRKEVRAGLVYEVVLTFEKAGPVKVDIPVGNPDEARKVEHS